MQSIKCNTSFLRNYIFWIIMANIAKGGCVMASVNWQKIKSVQQVKAIMRHDCKDTRERTQMHTNEHLRTNLTKHNIGLWDTYADAVRRYDDRMAALPKPKRKDAVLGLGFSIPAPDGLPQDQEEAWFASALKIMMREYGADNICCYCVHRDEQHEYVDPDTHERQRSRVHAQGILVPEHGGRLVAKEVTSRKRMVSINNALQVMSREQFGLDFMTGKRSKSRGNVETLKQRSRVAELERMERDRASREKAIADRERAVAAREAAVEAQERQARAEAQEAAQERQEAARERQAAQDVLSAARKEIAAYRQEVADTVQDRDKDAKVLKYAKTHGKDGRSIYDALADQADQVERKRRADTAARLSRLEGRLDMGRGYDAGYDFPR